jgi:hypothetical protein
LLIGFELNHAIEAAKHRYVRRYGDGVIPESRRMRMDDHHEDPPYAAPSITGFSKDKKNPEQSGSENTSVD